MSAASFVGTGFVNAGPASACQIIRTQELHFVESTSPRPDPAWSFVDSMGHFHAYDQAAEFDHYPTLATRVEVVPCGCEDHDDDCDGANIKHWHCQICGDEVVPGLIAGPHRESFAGLSSWEAKVSIRPEVLPEMGERVTLRVEVGEKQDVFGIALVAGMSVSSGDANATVELLGVGPLGSRAVKRHVAASR